MKKLRILAIMLVAVLALTVLVSCGGNNEADTGSDTPAAADVKGAMDEHGYYKVFVPEGYTLKHEDVFGDNNPKSFNINSDDSALTYFMFGMYDKDSAEMGVEATKEANEGAEDVTLDIDGVTWTGVAYESLGYSCFQLYAEFDGNFVTVNAAGNAYDSAIVKTVLGSLEVNVTE